MGAIKWDLRTCEACIKKVGNDPSKVACVKLKSLAQPGIALIAQDLIGWTCCPFTASWADVKAAAARLPNRAGMQDWAAKVLAEIKPKLKEYGNKPDMCGYVAGSGEANHPHTQVLADGRRTVWVRKLPAAQADQFYQWFFSHGLEMPVAQMTTRQKLTASVYLAIDQLPAEGKKLARELLESLPLLAALLAALALSPQKYMAFFRAVFYGFGIVTQAKEYMSLFGKWLAYAGGATTFSELSTGAEALARFLAMAIQDLGLAGLERFITFIRTKNADEFKDAAKRGGYTDDVKAADGSTAQIAAKAGMREMHLSRWGEWCRRNKAMTVLRTSEPTSLPRHFDMLTTGKPMELKWKTAKSGPHAGLVTVPDTAGMSPEEVKKLMAEIEKLKAQGYKFYPADGGPGALVTKDGYAFCSDVDKMGIYEQKNGAWQPHHRWQVNDDPKNQAWLNEEIYKYIEMDQHGGQDFFKKPVGPDGKMKPGRYPEAGEDFVVIHPDSRVEYVPTVSELQALYRKMGIAWPY